MKPASLVISIVNIIIVVFIINVILFNFVTSCYNVYWQNWVKWSTYIVLKLISILHRLEQNIREFSLIKIHVLPVTSKLHRADTGGWFCGTSAPSCTLARTWGVWGDVPSRLSLKKLYSLWNWNRATWSRWTSANLDQAMSKEQKQKQTKEKKTPRHKLTHPNTPLFVPNWPFCIKLGGIFDKFLRLESLKISRTISFNFRVKSFDLAEIRWISVNIIQHIVILFTTLGDDYTGHPFVKY